MVEVAHEALIRYWPELQTWIEKNRDDLRTREEIYQATKRWEHSADQAGELVSGAPLARAVEWKKNPDNAKILNKAEVDFLNRSQRKAITNRVLMFSSAILATAIISTVIVLAVTGQINRLIYRPILPEWVTVPAGEFLMGSTPEDIDAANQMENELPAGAIYVLTNETPPHRVQLDGFEISRFEITIHEYLRCVRAHVCSPLDDPEDQRYLDPNLSSHPMTNVNWFEASTYCEFINARLPTEAEWEKSARGTDARPYPWGDYPDETKANVYQGESGETKPVGSFELVSDSPYGVADMAGNVWEWVYDWYDQDFYSRSPEHNPIGPDTGDRHVIRGGSFENDWVQARTTFRNAALRPGDTSHDVGFRCVRGNFPQD
jgi:iron(II)-dependent oxidoreductase